MAKNHIIHTAKRPFGFRDILGYFMGDFGCNMSFTLISSYMFIFYTQYIGISLAHYSIIILITKIFDGINDPIIGAIVDRMGADKKGEKFKQWILRGSPFLALAATVIFIDAADWSYAAKLGLCIGGYILGDLTYTVVNVPYGALSSVMTSKPSQRAALSNARSWGYIIAGVPLGILIPLFTYEQVTKNGQTASIFRGERMFPIAIILGIISIVAFALLYLNTEERIQHTESEGEKVKFNYFITLKDFFRNRAILGISLASIAQIMFIMGGNQLHQLTYQMYFRDGTLSSYAILTQIIPLFVGTALGGSLVGKLGKKELSTWPLLGAIAVYAFLYLVEIKNPILWITMQIIANSFAFGLAIYTWGMVADAIDYQEWKTGIRNEGSVYATYSMLRKIAQGFGQSFIPAAIAILIPTLDVKDAFTWTSENALAIRDMAVLFPLIGYIIIFICFKFIFNLDRKTVAEMQVALGRDEE